MHTGAEQLLVPFWNCWVLRGGTSDAERLPDQRGWRLRLSWRARLTAWLFLLLFGGALLGTFLLWRAGELNQREFPLYFGGFTLFTLGGLYFLAFVYSYRVDVTEDGLKLYRLFLATRTLHWSDVMSFRLTEECDTLLIETNSGKLGIYASLNGLWAVRYCLSSYSSADKTENSWTGADPVLMKLVPAWRGDKEDEVRHGV